jgi:hypothetical protein
MEGLAAEGRPWWANRRFQNPAVSDSRRASKFPDGNRVQPDELFERELGFGRPLPRGRQARLGRLDIAG